MQYIAFDIKELSLLKYYLLSIFNCQWFQCFQETLLAYNKNAMYSYPLTIMQQAIAYFQTVSNSKYIQHIKKLFSMSFIDQLLIFLVYHIEVIGNKLSLFIIQWFLNNFSVVFMIKILIYCYDMNADMSIFLKS